MGGIKGLKIDWYCKFCNTHALKTPYYAKMEIYCNPLCQARDKKGKLPESLQKYYKMHPEKHREHGKLANPKKISETLKRKYKTGEIKPSCSLLGVKQSQKTKEKRIRTLRSVDMSSWKLGKSTSQKQKDVARDTIIRTRQKLARKGRLTNLEKIIDKYLHKNNIKHVHEFKIGGKSADFYLVETNEILEADSIYWHRDKDESLRDNYIKERMKEVKIIHLPESNLKDGTWLGNWERFSNEDS